MRQRLGASAPGRAAVHVYAVWLPVLATDDRVEWDDRILTDLRVTHLWDETQASGRWFATHGYGGGLAVQWDALFGYGPGARWGSEDTPSELRGWGRPIVAHADALADALRPLLTEP